MLRALDLFAGIGGVSLALRGIVEPVLMCELDPRKVEVLRRHHPGVPVHGDVRTLEAVPEGVDVVLASWPCTGFSVTGKRQEFDNVESALFRELVRVVDLARPALVFQENVPNVTRVMPLICAAFDGAGYDLRWICMSAHVVGSPQHRRRWYCLGIRRDLQGEFGSIRVAPFTRYSWHREPARMTPAPSPRLRPRLSMLGDAVVPDAVRLAFLCLCAAATGPDADLLRSREVALAMPRAAARGTPERVAAGAKSGACVRGSMCAYPFASPRVPAGYRVCLDPMAFDADAHRPERLPGVSRHALWSTPRGKNLGASRVLTKRTRRDLYTQLRFEASTPRDLRGGHPNLAWACWLMGFPQEYLSE